MLHFYLLSRQAKKFLCFFLGLFVGAGCNPVISGSGGFWLLALAVDEVSRNSMPPPKLPRNAPVLEVLHPSVPGIFLFFGVDDHLFVLNDLDHSVRNVAASDIPLWFNQWLDHVMRTRAETESHFIILFINE